MRKEFIDEKHFIKSNLEILHFYILTFTDDIGVF